MLVLTTRSFYMTTFTSYVLFESHPRDIPILSLQGWPHKRVRGKDYDLFIDKYVG